MVLESGADLTFEIVSGTEDAAKLVMAWRNDPETLKQSFHQEPKNWPEFHREFVEEYLKDSSVPCLFALADGKRVGFLRFRRVIDSANPRCRTADVSINVAPEERGKGYGSRMLKGMTHILRGLGLSALWAEIKVDNSRSRAIFEKAGFEYVGEYGHAVDDSGEKLRVNRFKLDLVKPAIVESKSECRSIGDGFPCFIIAEAGSNWRVGSPERDREMARSLVDIAKESGCDAVKFQTYRPETTYVANAGESEYLAENGYKRPISEIFADLAMPYEMLQDLADYCESQQILFMSSAFSVRDFEEVDRFSRIHKIASYEITHTRLLEAAARADKPLILSTGASDIEDISFAVDMLKNSMRADLCLMQCTASYPAPIDSMNLESIRWMKQFYGVPVGLSDHSRDSSLIPAAAVAVGANLIEKHFTVSNYLFGPDHKFALEPRELKTMVQSIRTVEEALGDGIKRVLSVEEELYQFARRGLQATKDIDRGVVFKEGENFDILRSGKQKLGMHPRNMAILQSARANRFIPAGEGINEADVEL
ncbi:MAG: GNAT family N-acetyltransferase [Cyanobacteria bacterium HKST-UBA01]|nr:GNAT family N-acetyltransferase [Cyanobacteria bacterium HKST-UBA01]